jgi:exonuclease SbcC
MIISSITLNNWMGHKKKKVDFSDGKNLIFGRNAAGKSSLAKAIAYGVTGVLPKNCDPRRENNKITVVDLEVNFDLGEEYLIRRQIKKGKRIRESLFIYKPDEPSEALYTDTKAQEFLKGKLGISGEVFERVIYMKEEDVHEFLANPKNAVITEIDRFIGLEKAPQLLSSIDKLLDNLSGEKRAIGRQKRDLEKGLKVKMGVDLQAGKLKDINKKIAAVETEITKLEQIREFISKKKDIKKVIKNKKKE